MKKIFACLVLPVFALLSAHGDGNEFTIVKNGIPQATIVLDAKPVKAAQFAAAELRHIVKLITGAELPVVKGGTPQGACIYIGESKEAKKLGVPEKNFDREEYLVLLKGKNLFLMGNDDPDYGRFDYSDVRTFPALLFNYRSTTYAVFDFLENSCGVRFYGFGDLGTVFKKRKTLSVAVGNIRRAPAMDAFRRPYFGNRTKEMKISDRDAALLQLRWRSNGMYGITNHSVYSIYYRYWDKALSKDRAKLFIEKRPEYFASNCRTSLTSAIRRHFKPASNPPPQLCTSHPGPIDYFASCAKQLFDGKKIEGGLNCDIPRMKGQRFFYPLQEDDNGDWCRCAMCSENLNRKYNFRHFDWINKVARKTALKDPAIGISTLAYSDTLDYPDGLELEKNISVQLCLGIQSWYHPRIYSRQHSAYKEWMRREASVRPMTVWIYMLCPATEARRIYNYKKFFPVVYPWKAGKYFKEFARDGIRGYFGEIEPEFHLLEAYVINKISDDPALDPDKLIDEYFTLYYGKAGDSMKKFYSTLESEAWDIKNYSQNVKTAFSKNSFTYGLHRERDNWHLGSPERIANLEKFVKAAESAAETPETKARLKLFRETIWDQALQGRKDFEERERIRAIAIPSITADYAGECRGNPGKVDFKNGTKLSDWKMLDNKEIQDSPELRLAADSTHLYFSFTEKGSEAFSNIKSDFWHNCCEFFLGTEKEGDYLQIVISPSGKASVFTNKIVEGVRRMSGTVLDLKINNSCSSGKWSFSGSVLLSAIPRGVRERDLFYGNFFRTKCFPGGVSLAWSPIFAKEYKEGFYRMGTIQLPGKSYEGVITDKHFAMNPENSAPEGWTRSKNYDMETPLSVKDGALALKGGNKKPLHLFYTEKGYIPANRGDKLIFEFKASGKGRADFGAYYYNGRGNGANMSAKSQTLKDNEQSYKVAVEVVNRNPRRPVTSLRPAIIVPQKHSIAIRDLKITLVRRE